MTHVAIRTASNGAYKITVDGVDMSFHVLRDGFKIELPAGVHEPARVHMVLAADVLEADLPQCVIEASRARSTSGAKRR